MDQTKHIPELDYDYFESPLGPLWLVAGAAGLSYLIREKDEDVFLSKIKDKTGQLPQKKLNKMSRWRAALVRYFSGEVIEFNGPISFLEGTPFQQSVWRTLLEIPYGSVRSYQWVGDQMGMKRAGRAIGNACGKNPIPVIIPCHRVVRQDGTLGGYTGGTAIKKKLLALEGVTPK
ncbi:MAG: methylated-DNA--[protein]-cysteine S-methyltransferase [Nitrospirota bacterium]|nr:methylated-DNA--[protein]-cysteine S-methyltransferase [Nitrospirota bacterium]